MASTAPIACEPRLTGAERREERRASMPAIRSEPEIEGIRRAGDVVARALDAACAACVAGATAAEIDRVARDVIELAGAMPAFLGYRGPRDAARSPFPAAACVCVGAELVHAIPGTRVIRDGDLVSIDVGVRLDGWHADGARTVAVGAVDARARAMLACAEEMLAHAIAAIRPGRRWSTIASELERLACDGGFAIAGEFVGHGVGRELHEPPQVPCVVDDAYRAHDDFTLRPGLVLAIEPMLVLEPPQRDAAGSLVSPRSTLGGDGWTVTVASGAPSCHVEHTVAVRADGAEVLTVSTERRQAA